MKLIITISKKNDSAQPQHLEIDKFPIVIGRDEKNEIVLPDVKKIISRNHAKIVETDGLLQLVDLGSANCTYLNDEKILPSDEYALKSGDLIKIGEYELSLEIVFERDTRTFDDQKTMIFDSPFANEISNFSQELKKLSDKYTFDNSPGKEEMLRFSIMQSLGAMENNEATKIISEYFTHKFLDEIHTSRSEEVQLDGSQQALSKSEQPKIEKISKQDVSSSSQSVTNYSFSSHFSSTVDIMLDNLIKLIQGFLHFRQEFFGVTIYHTIPTGSLKEIKEYLFNPDISTEEQNKRINLIKEEAQKLLVHQIGLLEGYKISVTEGSQSLLQSLDPELIEKEAERKQASGIANLLPYSKKLKTLELINDSYKKFISDPYHLEKKFFRPAFIKGYQKRISTRNEKNEY
ncbi:MAG: FHA domain-containing protein [Ignavibacteriaceae bacterium]|jgi:type VI secretion system protein ImpI|nr:FHA domain-containing protein [Ignavibacteriaceae bacterium]MCW9064661.1 FHA domain-containing protein [Ignavibacteriaceae bacterium]